ncbi:ROK family transcriptional regulator [Agromyces endophyticus]|uniref:ROK family transcriptional regulator n=1 Tax=Agromyces sp. H17E-10 TaxID=2932244 RepID=UPI001FD5307B|nr:ROK family transcriptional regulator [Agromyces sp. H17E-10]UOQ90280.1 ROK family transcriptional regulator [Agromyces sp. H17E-10]
MTRADLADHIRLSRTTVSEITASLLDRGVISVSEDDTPRLGRGRPAEILTLDPAAGQYVGVDFAHRRVRVAVANAAHELIASDTAPYEQADDWPTRVDAAFALIERMAEEHELHFSGVLGVGIGFPGPFSPRLPRGESEPVAEARRAGAALVVSSFERRFSAPVVLDNNTRLAALAEAAWVTATEVDHLLYVRLSAGIGGGVVVSGRLVTGATGLAGEIGHMTVGGHQRDCRCGKRGCLETVASIGAVLDRCRDAGVEFDGIAALAAAAEKGDPVAIGALREAGEATGHVLGSLAVALNPSDIVIGGEIAQIADVVVEQAAATIAYELVPVGGAVPRIRRATLGDEGGAIGGIIALLRGTPLLAGYHPSVDSPPAEPRLRRSAP